MYKELIEFEQNALNFKYQYIQIYGKFILLESSLKKIDLPIHLKVEKNFGVYASIEYKKYGANYELLVNDNCLNDCTAKDIIEANKILLIFIESLHNEIKNFLGIKEPEPLPTPEPEPENTLF
jgi:hypothetical protein